MQPVGFKNIRHIKWKQICTGQYGLACFTFNQEALMTASWLELEQPVELIENIWTHDL